MTPDNQRYVAVTRAMLLGLCVLIASTVTSFFAWTSGVSTDTNAWPPGARAILAESPGVPLSSEQWARIEAELARDPSRPLPIHLLAAEVRKTWPIFVFLVGVALILTRLRWRSFSLLHATVLATPTALALLGASILTHPYYR